jgi:hypothetical protein
MKKVLALVLPKTFPLALVVKSLAIPSDLVRPIIRFEPKWEEVIAFATVVLEESVLVVIGVKVSLLSSPRLVSFAFESLSYPPSSYVAVLSRVCWTVMQHLNYVKKVVWNVCVLEVIFLTCF